MPQLILIASSTAFFRSQNPGRMPQRKSIGDWLAGCRNALPAIVCHAILRLKNAVENQLLMVPLDVRVAGRWYLGVIRKLRNALGGVGHVLHFVTWGEAMPVLRNGPVVRQFLALHAFHTCAMRAPRARLTRACLCIIFEGGSGAAVLRNLGGGDSQTVVTLRYLGGG